MTMTMRKRALFIFTLFLLGFGGANAIEKPPRTDVALLSEASAVKPGDTILLGVHFKLEKGWHIYWKVSGDSGYPTRVKWSLPEGITVSDLLWPRPKTFKEAGDIITYGYKDETALLAQLTVPQNWPVGKPIVIKARVDWLICEVACLPDNRDLMIRLPVERETIYSVTDKPLLEHFVNQVPSTEEEQEILAPAPSLSIFVALLFAFLGGLLLNIMPCVLPVLSIKALRLLKQSENNRRDVFIESLCYVGGVLLSFLIMAATVIVLKNVGQNIGWGFQFQEPRFLLVLTLLVFGFGLSLFGVYEFTVFLPTNITRLTQHGHKWGSFWEGILATALATPCTAPFLGAALGFAFSQSAPIITLFFGVIGLGLALPYLLLAVSPGWVRFLPKPGDWMETFKQAMGFPLMATAIWLVWVLGQQTNHSAVIGTLSLLLLLTVGLWALGKWATPLHPPRRRWALRILLLLIIMPAYLLLVERPINTMATTSAQQKWETYSSERVDAELKKGNAVFVDFTADWCLTCQLNKRTVLHSSAITTAFKEHGIVPLIADWTRRDDDITRVLKSLNRSGVPVYALYTPGAARPVLFPELLTEKIVLDAVQNIPR